MRSTPRRSALRGLLLEGVVLRTYLPDDPSHPAYQAVIGNVGPVVNGRISSEPVQRFRAGVLRRVLCDVFVADPQERGQVLRLVPVAQHGPSRSDSDRWIPRGTSRSATGLPPVPTKELAPGEVPQAISNPADLDGEQVVVTFLGGDQHRPLILCSLEHPWAEVRPPAWRPTTAVQGPANERVIRHRGTVLRWDSDGNLTVDATLASSGALDIRGSEIVGLQGAITVKAKATQTVRIEGGTIAMALPGAAAIRLVARKDDGIHGNLETAVGGQNENLANFLVALGAALTALGSPAPPPWATWADFTTAVVASGIDGKVSSGNANVKTD